MTDIEKEILRELSHLRDQVGKINTDVAVLAERTGQITADVAVLKSRVPEKSKAALRDGGITVTGGAIGAAILAAIQNLSV